MSTAHRSVFALLVGVSLTAFVSQASAQVSEHRTQAIKKCNKLADSEYPDRNIYNGGIATTSMRAAWLTKVRLHKDSPQTMASVSGVCELALSGPQAAYPYDNGRCRYRGDRTAWRRC
jgi:hypothetical protein